MRERPRFLRRADPRLTAEETLRLVSAAADLAICLDISWRVDDRSPTPAPRLAAEMRSARALDHQFVVPREAGRWFKIRYSGVDAGYSLAFLYSWALDTCADAQTPELCATETLHWYLDKSWPQSDREGLKVVEQAVEAFGRRSNAAVDPAR